MDELSLGLADLDLRDGAHLVRVRGEVDIATAPAFRGALLHHTEGDVHVDLSDVSFMDSSGLSVLLSAHKAVGVRGSQLIVHGATGAVLRTMEITGMHEVLNLNGQAPTPIDD